ncbi:MAG TPA: hypothetical protein VIX37_19115 [Candidatus Sulfotelmatobacter sp.]
MLRKLGLSAEAMHHFGHRIVGDCAHESDRQGLGGRDFLGGDEDLKSVSFAYQSRQPLNASPARNQPEGGSP